MHSKPNLLVVANLMAAWFSVGATVSAAQSTHTAKARAVVQQLQGTKIISIQDHDKMNGIDQEGMAGVWGDSPIKEYDRNYAHRLKESLGVDLVVVRSDELLAEMAEVPDAQARQLADLWIREATEIKNVTHADIVRPA